MNIANVFATINGGFPFTSGQPNTVTFNFNANSNPASASISGNNLWQILVYSSSTNNGNPSDITSQQLAVLGSQSGLDLVGGDLLEFTNLQVRDCSFLCLCHRRWCRRHYVFGLSVRRYVRPAFLLSRYLKNHLRYELQTS